MASDELIATLSDAMQTGEVLNLVYFGGSNPGTARPLAPINFIDNGEKIRARCFNPDVVKTFIVDKFTPPELAADSSMPAPTPKHRSTHKQPLDPSDAFELFLEQYAEQWQTLGWDIELAQREDDFRVCLFGRFKNGKLRKKPSFCLSHEVFRFDDYSRVRANRLRPWIIVDNVAKRTQSFKSFTKVADTFLLLISKAS